MRSLLCITALLGIAASGAAQNQRKGDATAFVAIAEAEIAQLHDGITFARWRGTRGKSERWEYRTPEIVPTEPHPECLVLVKTEALPSGAKVVRALSFFPPRVPTPAVFPLARGSRLIGECVLAMVRVEAEASTPEAGHSLEEAVRRYRDPAAKGIRGAEIVSGYDTKPGLSEDAPGELVRGPVAFVRARLPMVQALEHATCCVLRTYRYLPIERAQFHQALSLAGADTGLSGRLAKLYEQVFESANPSGGTSPPGNTSWQGSLVPLLRRWLSFLKSASPAIRAAGLLAADRLLDAAGDAGDVPGWPQQQGERSELQRLGAAFELNEFEGDYYYARNWEKQARALDPNGAIGKMAVIGPLARGSCRPWTHDFFRHVIRDGQRLLANGLDSPTAAQVHFMVADAYSDIVAIAGGDSGPNGEYDPKQFKNEAGTARIRALEHYRAGLSQDNTSENAKDAWRQAWRLAAGLLPAERYVCFGD